MSDSNVAPDLPLAPANTEQDTNLKSSPRDDDVHYFAGTLVSKPLRSNTPKNPVGEPLPKRGSRGAVDVESAHGVGTMPLGNYL